MVKKQVSITKSWAPPVFNPLSVKFKPPHRDMVSVFVPNSITSPISLDASTFAYEPGNSGNVRKLLANTRPDSDIVHPEPTDEIIQGIEDTWGLTTKGALNVYKYFTCGDSNCKFKCTST